MIIPNYDKALAAYTAAQARVALAQHAYHVASIAKQEAKDKLAIAKIFRVTTGSQDV